MRKQITITSVAVVLSIFATSAFGGPQVLEVSPTTLGFSAIEGGANPTAQAVSIWNSGHANMDWTVTADCNWLVVEPNSGTSSGEVDDANVIVDINGLTGGIYNCQLTVTGSGAPNSPQIVDVNLVVDGPWLSVHPTSIEFTANEGGPNPAEQVLSINNPGGGTLKWSITEDCNWLTAEPNTGSSTGETDDVNLSVDVTGLAAGSYSCELFVEDPNVSGDPNEPNGIQVVDVNLMVVGPVLEVSPSLIEFTALIGGPNPADQVLSISNSGGGTLNWQISEECSWLTVEPNAGNSTGEVDDVNLSVDIMGLAVGVYDCNLTVSDSNASNSPQVVDVNLVVYDSNPVSWWRFDEGSGDIAYDSAGDNDGNLINGPVWTGGIIDGAIEFDGVDDYVNVNSVGELNFERTDAYTLSAWYKGDVENHAILSKMDSPIGYRGYDMYIFSGYVRAHIINDWPFNAICETGTLYPISDSIWHHIVVTYDGSSSSNGLKIYVDGMEEITTVEENSLSSTIQNSVSFKIAARGGTSTTHHLGGLIDEVRIYGRSLSASEVAQLWEDGLGGERAFNPEPYDGASGVEMNVVLSWSAGLYAADVNGHDVYFGTAYTDVNDATTSSAEYMGRQDANNWDSSNYDANGLGYATTYYWRIDEVNDSEVNSPWRGNVWSFETVKPEIGLSGTQFNFMAFEGGANPNDQVLGISNTGGGTLNWEVSEDCNWLTVEPNTGSSMGEVDDVNLSVEITGLAVGIYDCNLTILDANASNSPQVVGVTLVVGTEDELLVPTEYSTIQAGIDAAVHGNTVIVEPNTYTGEGNRDLDFGGKVITVRSTDPEDPCVVAGTVIDCNGSVSELHRGFYLHSGEGINSVISGFTITGGYHEDGGGIYLQNAGATISHCRIVGNSTEKGKNATSGSDANDGGDGGGIYSSFSTVRIEG
ncbi:MAG: BACON domain-containing protein, partial [Planctomycetota bacterium]